jgi:hypothetical protein
VIKPELGHRGFSISGILQKKISFSIIINAAGMEKQPSSLRKQKNPQNLVQRVTERVDVPRGVPGDVKVTRFQIRGEKEKPTGTDFGMKAGILQDVSARAFEESPGLSRVKGFFFHGERGRRFIPDVQGYIRVRVQAPRNPDPRDF